MSDDFEVLPRGSIQELKLSRELVAAIEQITSQFGTGIVPHSVFTAYAKLRDHHAIRMESENL